METLELKPKQFGKGDLLKKHECHKHQHGMKAHTAQKLGMFKTNQK